MTKQRKYSSERNRLRECKETHANRPGRGVALITIPLANYFAFLDRLLVLVFTMLKKLLSHTDLEKNFSSLYEEVSSNRQMG